MTVEQYPEVAVSLDTTETPSDDKKESSGKKKKVRKSKSDLEADSSISEPISTEISTEIGIEESKSALSIEESISITTSSEQGESLPQDGDAKKKKVIHSLIIPIGFDSGRFFNSDNDFFCDNNVPMLVGIFDFNLGH